MKPDTENGKIYKENAPPIHHCHIRGISHVNSPRYLSSPPPSPLLPPFLCPFLSSSSVHQPLYLAISGDDEKWVLGGFALPQILIRSSKRTILSLKSNYWGLPGVCMCLGVGGGSNHRLFGREVLQGDALADWATGAVGGGSCREKKRHKTQDWKTWRSKAELTCIREVDSMYLNFPDLVCWSRQCAECGRRLNKVSANNIRVSEGNMRSSRTV